MFGSHMQGRLFIFIFVIDVAAGVEQSAGDGEVAVSTGQVERRVVVLVTGVHQTGRQTVTQQHLGSRDFIGMQFGDG